MAVRLLRVLYAIEFLAALATVSIFWRETAGQFHMDLIPWFLKFGFIAATSAVGVKLTAVSLENRRRAKLLWGAALLAFITAACLTTYYYHLHEPLDEENEGMLLSIRLEICDHAS